MGDRGKRMGIVKGVGSSVAGPVAWQEEQGRWEIQTAWNQVREFNNGSQSSPGSHCPPPFGMTIEELALFVATESSYPNSTLQKVLHSASRHREMRSG